MDNILSGSQFELSALPLGSLQGGDRFAFWDNNLSMGLLDGARSSFATEFEDEEAWTLESGLELAPSVLPITPSASAIPPANLLPLGLNQANWNRPDFNHDGQVDLLWRDYTTGRNTVWLMQGTTRQTVVDLPAVPDAQWRIQGVADFNQDGQSDILWQHGTTGAVAVWFMAETTLVSSAHITTVPDVQWQIQGIGDFNGDRQPDLLWRHQSTGANHVWFMQGTSFLQAETLPESVGANLKMQGTGDFNGDGQPDILWRDYLSGETTVWLMQGTQRLGIQTLPTVADVNWQVQAVVDLNQDGQPDILWRQAQSGAIDLWQMRGTTLTTVIALPAITPPQDPISVPTPPVASAAALATAMATAATATAATVSAVVLSNLVFSGREGDAGTLQIQLSQAPTSDVMVTLTAGAWLTVDADGLVQNGTQSTLTFTAQNWNQPRTLRFLAENDDTSADRSSNLISYSLSGGSGGSGVYELGPVVNTYAPDLNHFNIDLDFRNDATGFWTPARRAIAQTAANDWARAIANEWTGFALDNSVNLLDRSGTRPYSFTSRRYVDDLVVFINNYTSSTGQEPAVGGPDYEFGGWMTTPTALMPRVGQVAISSDLLANQSDLILYQVVAHELGHTLGLLGLNWAGYVLQDLSNPQTATFRGEYSRVANGGNYVPLQSQEGGDFFHPGSSVRSIMSYGWIYDPRTTSPTLVDYAMLADSGYQIYGINYGGAVTPS